MFANIFASTPVRATSPRQKRERLHPLSDTRMVMPWRTPHILTLMVVGIYLPASNKVCMQIRCEFRNWAQLIEQVAERERQKLGFLYHLGNSQCFPGSPTSTFPGLNWSPPSAIPTYPFNPPRIQWHHQAKMGNGRLLTSSTKGRGGRTGVLLPSPSDD